MGQEPPTSSERRPQYRSTSVFNRTRGRHHRTRKLDYWADMRHYDHRKTHMPPTRISKRTMMFNIAYWINAEHRRTKHWFEYVRDEINTIINTLEIVLDEYPSMKVGALLEKVSHEYQMIKELFASDESPFTYREMQQLDTCLEDISRNVRSIENSSSPGVSEFEFGRLIVESINKLTELVEQFDKSVTYIENNDT